MSRNALIWSAIVLAFAGLLLWSTLEAQSHECTVTVRFKGGENSATASGDSEEAAETQARNTACGPLAAGMSESIACTNTPPVKKECRTI